ncbi:hypothetical protein GCM10022243_65510 [Saccharothrix violaceirubra]
MKVEDVIRETKVSRQTIFRMLSGDGLARWPSVSVVLDVVGASPEERTKALQLWEVADVDPSGVEHARDLPAGYLRFRLDELEAVRERSLDPVFVPGLLQTAGYAEALARAAGRRVGDGAWSARAAAERLERQKVLTGDRPLEYEALVDQAALLRMVGGREVMREQLRHLAAVTARPNVTIRVLPLAVGAYGAQSGGVHLLDFAEEDEPQAGYVEGFTGLVPVEDAVVGVLSAVWGDAARLALTADDSRELVESTLSSSRW